MPAISKKKKNPSAEKRVRQAEKNNLRNKSAESRLRTLLKKFEDALASKNKEEVAAAFKKAIKVISMAKSKGIIKPNTASRQISRLAKNAGSFSKSEAA